MVPEARIVIPNAGQPVPYLYGVGGKERGSIHLFMSLTIPGLERCCRKIEGQHGGPFALEGLLRAPGNGQGGDPAHGGERGLARRLQGGV